mgnify:CR=1 FL=1
MEGSSKKWPLLLSLTVFLAILALCVKYIRLTTTSIAGIDLSPANYDTAFRFTLQDGTVLFPEDGELPLEGTDSVVICQIELPEGLTEKPLFVVTSNRADCVILLNNNLVYAPSGRYADGHFSTSPYTNSSASGQFIAHLNGENDSLTMLVQLQGENRGMKHLPKLMVYPSIMEYYTQPLSAAAEAAFPAGMYFSIALSVAALFFILFWNDRPDFGLILLTFCSLSMALASTAPYAVYVVAALQWPAGSWFCSTLPIAVMSWNLWYRLQKRAKIFTLPFIGITTVFMLYYLITGYGRGNTSGGAQMNALQALILPAVMAFLLLAAGIDATKGNLWFRRFFRYFLYFLPIVGIIFVFSSLTGGIFANSMQTAFSHIRAYHSFCAFCQQICILFLILCFLHAVADLIAILARRDAQMQSLSLREKYARENVETMLQSQEETRRISHEKRHHISLMDEFLSKQEYVRAQEYVHSLSDTISAIPSNAYSDHLVVNAIVGRYLNSAKRTGISVTADIQASDTTVLQDEELCVLLTNLLENALEACLSMPADADRFIRFKFRSSREHLTIRCENSTNHTILIEEDGTVTTSKEDKKHHGYGIASMRQIIKKQDGLFKISCVDGCFTVEATL